MLRADKERVVTELVERLRNTQTMFVADYRGLSVSELYELRTKLVEHGARFTIVKNTLTRRAAEEAGADALLALIDGPTAITFVESDGDMIGAAKALADVAGTTRVLAIRGGILDGSPAGEAEVKSLATLPPVDVLRGQVVGAIAAPLITVVGLISAPVRDLLGLIDARIVQLGEQSDTSAEEAAAAAPAAEEQPAAEPAAESADEPSVEASAEEAVAETAEEQPAEAEEAAGDEKEEG